MPVIRSQLTSRTLVSLTRDEIQISILKDSQTENKIVKKVLSHRQWTLLLKVLPSRLLQAFTIQSSPPTGVKLLTIRILSATLKPLE